MTDELLSKLSAAVYRSLATDDRTGGEGLWAFRIDPDGTSRVALPPDGTQAKTMQALLGRVSDEIGGGHLAEVWVDPSDHGRGKRVGIVVEGAYAPPGLHPGPAGPSGPEPPPAPPAKADEID